MSFKVIVTYKHILKRHIYASVISWCSWPSLAGAPKLGESAQTRRERPNSATVTIYLWETLTAKLCYLEGLAILVSKALVFLSRIGSVGWVWWISIRDQCFVIRWCDGGRVSSIPAFRREALPTLRTSPMIPNWPWAWPCWNCTGSYKFYVSVKKMGEGRTGGASDIGAHGKRRSFSPGAAARPAQGSDQSPFGWISSIFLALISARSFFLYFFRTKLSDLRNFVGRRPISPETC